MAEQSAGTRRLLAGGIVAGPLFLAVWLIQALTRDGFDPGRHPISLLSLGSLGWIQILNFVVAGSLYVAMAVGVRRVLQPGRGGTWGPRLIAAMGVGLILAGVFVTDAGAGFPAGAPAGKPESITWHGMLHEVGFLLATVSWTAACVVILRRFAALGERRWVAICVAAVIAVVVLGAWPDLDSVSVRLVLASAVEFGFLAALAARLRHGVGNPAAADQLSPAVTPARS